MKTLALLALLITFSFAQVLGDPAALTQKGFNAKQVSISNIILTPAQMSELTKLSAQKIDSKLFRVYVAKNGDKIAGYGVLVNKKVRTKSAVTVYIIGVDQKIKSVEIVAFYEPMDYLPTETWLNVFDNKTSNDTLKLNQDIPTTTGATVSARAITDGARLALSLLEVIKP